MTSKVKAASKVHKHQKENHQNNSDLDKTGERTADGRRNNNKEGENTNMGQEQVTAKKDDTNTNLRTVKTPINMYINPKNQFHIIINENCRLFENKRFVFFPLHALTKQNNIETKHRYRQEAQGTYTKRQNTTPRRNTE